LWPGIERGFVSVHANALTHISLLCVFGGRTGKLLPV